MNNTIDDYIRNFNNNGPYEKDLNVKAFLSFKAILAEILNHFSKEEGITINASLLDKICPTSGWITIKGENINLNNLSGIKEHMDSISNIEVLLDAQDNIVISIMFYDIITRTKGE